MKQAAFKEFNGNDPVKIEGVWGTPQPCPALSEVAALFATFSRRKCR